MNLLGYESLVGMFLSKFESPDNMLNVLYGFEDDGSSMTDSENEEFINDLNKLE